MKTRTINAAIETLRAAHRALSTAGDWRVGIECELRADALQQELEAEHPTVKVEEAA